MLSLYDTLFKDCLRLRIRDSERLFRRSEIRIETGKLLTDDVRPVPGACCGIPRRHLKRRKISIESVEKSGAGYGYLKVHSTERPTANEWLHERVYDVLVRRFAAAKIRRRHREQLHGVRERNLAV